MVSEAQLAANAANAQKGGVKTEEGKATVRLNAVTHGLTSKEVLLRGEDGETLDTLRRHIISELQPQGELETLLADLIVSDSWRLKRAIKMETIYLQGALEWFTSVVERKSPEEIMAKAKMSPIESVPWKLLIVEAMGNQGGLLNLERYRTAVERHLYRSLNELHQLQAARHSGKTPQTLAIAAGVPQQ